MKNLIVILLLFLNLSGFGQSRAQVTKPGEKRKIYALVVGISKYKNIDTLSYAHTDAMAFSNFLKMPSMQAEVFEFYNEEATKARIVDEGFYKITKMVDQNVIGENDIIIVYMSGHGGAFSVNSGSEGGSEDSYFFPYDALTMQDGGTSIKIFDIKKDIEKWVHAKRKVLLVFDACRSATIDGMPKDAIKRVSEILEEKNGEVLFAASSGGHEAIETANLEHGLFTYYFLRGLYGEADGHGGGTQNGEVTLKELFEFAYNNVKNTSERDQIQFQKPKAEYANLEEFTLTKVNTALQATIDKAIEPKEVHRQYVARGRKAGGSSDKILQALEKKFKKALEQNRFIKPDTLSALYYFRQMEKRQPNAAELNEFRSSLLAALYEASRKVLENDLKGLRLYMRPSKNDTIQESGGYDQSYYSNPIKWLQVYDVLKNDKTNSGTEKMRLYFKGRNEWLLYESEDDSVLYRKHLNISLETFAKATETFPKEPYLLEGYAVSLTRAVDEFDKRERDVNKVKSLVERVKNLAPRWSYPYSTLGELYYFLDNDKEAEKWNEAAIRLNSNDPLPYLTIGDIHYEREKPEEYAKALGYYKKAYAIDSTLVMTLLDIGATYERLGDTKSATTYYEKIFKLDPNFVAALANYASMLKKSDDKLDKEKAVQVLTKMLKVDPNSDWALYHLADVLNDLERNDEAEIHITKACQLTPDDYYNWILLVTIQKDQQNLTAARKTCESLIIKFPKKSLAYDLIAQVYQEQGVWPKAKEYFRKAFKMDQDVDYLKNLGTVFDETHSNEPDSLLKIRLQIIDLEPTLADNYSHVASIYYELKKYHESKLWYEKAVQVDSTYFIGQYNLGMSYESLGDYGNSRKAFLKAQRLDSTDADVFYYIGFTNCKLGNHKEAIRNYSISLRLDSAYKMGYFQIGLCFGHLDDYQNAKSSFLKYTQLNPTDYKGQYQLGLANRNMEKFDEAVQSFLRAIAIDSTDSENYYELAITYGTYMNNISAHGTYMRKALRVYMKNSQVNPKNATYLAFCGEAHQRLREYDLALSFLDKADALDPKHSLSHRTRGNIYLYQKRYPDAERELKLALEFDPEFPTRLYNIACFYSVTGDKSQSLEWLQKALEKGYNQFVFLKYDPDLKTIRETEEYKALLSKYVK